MLSLGLLHELRYQMRVQLAAKVLEPADAYLEVSG